MGRRRSEDGSARNLGWLWNSVVIAAAITASLGMLAPLLIEESKAPICEAAANWLADETPSPYLTEEQRRRLAVSNLETVLHCNRRASDD